MEIGLEIILFVTVAAFLLNSLRSPEPSSSWTELRIRQLEKKLDLLLEHANIEVPGAEVPEEVLMHIQNGEKIKAIKAYREFSGAGLKDAKNYVESIM